jgi:hypothetical protein
MARVALNEAADVPEHALQNPHRAAARRAADVPVGQRLVRRPSDGERELQGVLRRWEVLPTPTMGVGEYREAARQRSEPPAH